MFQSLFRNHTFKTRYLHHWLHHLPALWWLDAQSVFLGPEVWIHLDSLSPTPAASGEAQALLSHPWGHAVLLLPLPHVHPTVQPQAGLTSIPQQGQHYCVAGPHHGQGHSPQDTQRGSPFKCGLTWTGQGKSPAQPRGLHPQPMPAIMCGAEGTNLCSCPSRGTQVSHRTHDRTLRTLSCP